MLGDVEHYVEPFAGSLAVLFGRPTASRIETVNDKDAYIVNFWRAVAHDPEQVAHYANNPVNENDLTARHIWLVNQGKDRVARIDGDPDYYDAKVAGWWVWGICSWIGGGWCAGSGPWGNVDGKLVNLRENDWPQGPQGRGVSKRRPRLGNGPGVNRKRPHLGNAGQGVNTGEAELIQYMNQLAERLRYVRVCCGDWKRVVTNGALAHGREIGIFLDPPYDMDIRDATLYNHDTPKLSTEVRDWCIANQDNPRYRIVLAGYEGEHELPGWRVISWSAGSSYQRASGNGNNAKNRKLERLWLSPGCLTATDTKRELSLRLFDDDQN